MLRAVTGDDLRTRSSAGFPIDRRSRYSPRTQTRAAHIARVAGLDVPGGGPRCAPWRRSAPTDGPPIATAESARLTRAARSPARRDHARRSCAPRRLGPLDAERRVVPADARRGLRDVRVRDQVEDVGVVDERLEAVGAPFRDVERPPVLLVELGRRASRDTSPSRAAGRATTSKIAPRTQRTSFASSCGATLEVHAAKRSRPCRARDAHLASSALRPAAASSSGSQRARRSRARPRDARARRRPRRRSGSRRIARPTRRHARVAPTAALPRARRRPADGGAAAAGRSGDPRRARRSAARSGRRPPAPRRRAASPTRTRSVGNARASFEKSTR